MADNFAIYMPFQDLPPQELLEELAPDAQVTLADGRATVAPQAHRHSLAAA